MSTEKYRLPKTKHGLKTFNKIIASGKRLFSERGYLLTSVNDIISESGVAAGTFYIYFDDKLTLYNYILDVYKKRIRDKIRDNIKHCTTRFEIEREGIKAFIQFAYEDRLAYNIIWESLFIDYKIFKAYYQTFAKDYSSALKRAQLKGEVRNVNLETLSYVLMGISNFVGLQVMFKESMTEKELDAIIDQVMDILRYGMFVT